MLEWLERKLLIQHGEGGSVLYFLCFFILVSAGMAVGRSTADALFLKRLGIEYLPLMYIIQSLMLAAVSIVYAAFADRLPAEKFFRVLFSILLMLVVCCWLVMTASGNALVYPAYYLVYEVASELLLVHATLYMSQNITTLQAKRLMPLVFAGAQIGAISGGLALLIGTPLVGTQNLLLLWCLLLISASILLALRHRRHGASTHFRAPKKSRSMLRESIEQVNQGIKFTYRYNLLRAASFSLFFMVITFYIISYSVNRIYTQTFDTEESLTRFFGLLAAATSSIALVAQLFITNRTIQRFGIRTMNLLYPWTTVAAMAALTASFAFPSALFGSFNKDSIMPAFRNPVRSMFFNALPDYMQGRARAMSVALVLPLALMTCGLLLVVLQRLDNPLYFLAPGMLAAGLYLIFSRLMNKAYVSTLITTLKERLFLPDKRMYADLQGCGDDTLDEIRRGIEHPDAEVALAFANMLASSFPDRAVELILQRAANTENATAERFVKILATLDLSGHVDDLRRLGDQWDGRAKSTIMRLLLEQGDAQTIAEASAHLESSNPSLRSIAIHAALRFPASENSRKQAFAIWHAMLGADKAAQLASLDLIPDLSLGFAEERERLVEGYLQSFVSLLEDPAESTRIRALRGLQRWQGTVTAEINAAVVQALGSDNPVLRIAAAGCLHLVKATQREQLLLQTLGDGHALVRDAAIESLRAAVDNYHDLALQWIATDRGSLRAQQTLLMSLLDAGLPEKVFENIVHSKVQALLQLQEAASILERGTQGDADTALSLLKFTLREQLEGTIDLALTALEPLYKPGIIAIIRAGFSSGDSRHVANACEVLDNLDNLDNLDKQHMIASLSSALQQSASGEFCQHEMSFRSVDEVLNWCAQHRNSWLRLCGEQALESAAGCGHA